MGRQHPVMRQRINEARTRNEKERDSRMMKKGPKWRREKDSNYTINPKTRAAKKKEKRPEYRCYN